MSAEVRILFLVRKPVFSDATDVAERARESGAVSRGTGASEMAVDGHEVDESIPGA